MASTVDIESGSASVATVDTTAPLRLGYVIDTLVTGGAERLVVTFSETVRQHPEVDLTVFVLSDKETPFRERLEGIGVKVVTLPGRNLFDPGRFLRLVRALRQYRIEYVHAHLASATSLAAFAAFLLRVPFVTTIHNVKPSARRIRRSRRALHSAALKLPTTRVIAVGKAVADAMQAEGYRRECVVVPNAVSTSDVASADARAATRAELGLADNDIAIVCVGAIIGQKAHEILLESFATVADHTPSAMLLIVGDSRDPDRKERLDAQAADLGISARVKFLGMRRDIPNILAASDIFVSSSDWEGAPVSLLEAMVNSLPPVMTDVGENDLVLDGTGAIIVPPRQPAALADGMIRLIQDSDLRAKIGQAVRDRAAGDYGADVWVDRLLAFYAATGRRHDWHRKEIT